MTLDQKVATGYVEVGWQPALWADRLRYLADQCEHGHPELAAQYRAWARNIRIVVVRPIEPEPPPVAVVPKIPPTYTRY